MKHILILMILAGCSTAAPTLRPASDDTCNAAEYTDLIGQPVTALEKILLLGKVRIIRPGQPVTMDFWPDRINFALDEEDAINAIKCG